jgi:hypothetical protein
MAARRKDDHMDSLFGYVRNFICKIMFVAHFCVRVMQTTAEQLKRLKQSTSVMPLDLLAATTAPRNSKSGAGDSVSIVKPVIIEASDLSAIKVGLEHTPTACFTIAEPIIMQEQASSSGIGESSKAKSIAHNTAVLQQRRHSAADARKAKIKALESQRLASLPKTALQLEEEAEAAAIIAKAAALRDEEEVNTY